MISIIIPTLNRTTKIIHCLRSVLSHTNGQIEIILLDQNRNTSRPLVHFIHAHSDTVRYIKSDTQIKSAALNKAIAAASGETLAFTDDDCIVTPDWVAEIVTSFDKHPEIACVTGNTYPYNNIPKWACPPTISTKRTIFSRPIYHASIGFGNNIAIRKSVFTSIGLYKTWLGPGSVSTNCEDGEMMLRILTRGYTILHNPKMVVYHNKKLNISSLKKQNLSYISGEMACYAYYAFSGYEFAKRVINNNIRESFRDFKKFCGDIIKRGVVRPDDWKYSATVFYTRLRGFLIGTTHYVKEAKLHIKDGAGSFH